MAGPIERFIGLLECSPENGAVFNPWWEVDAENDVNPQAPRIRREQLTNYLRGRLGRASVALIGEALGYRGGHFTGIPTTSERILLSQKAERADHDHLVLSIRPRRTSKFGALDAIGTMYAFDAATGTILWTFASGGSVNSSPAIVDGVVYWGSGYARIQGTPNNKFYAFEVR